MKLKWRGDNFLFSISKYKKKIHKFTDIIAIFSLFTITGSSLWTVLRQPRESNPANFPTLPFF